jgi:hypothetical protein
VLHCRQIGPAAPSFYPIYLTDKKQGLSCVREIPSLS